MKFPAFSATRKFITTFKRSCHLSLSWARLIQSIHHIPLLEDPPIYACVFQVNCSLRLHQNPVCISPLPHKNYMTRPSYSSWDRPNNIWRGVQIISSSLSSLFQSPVYSSLLVLDIFLSTLFSKTVCLYSFLSVEDQVSHSYLPTSSLQCKSLVLWKWKWHLYRDNCLVNRHCFCNCCI